MVQILVADANKPADLVAVAQQTRLLLNCVGPYRYTGEAIVNACVEAGTDYLDVSGEPGMDPSKSRTACTACCFCSLLHYIRQKTLLQPEMCPMRARNMP